ncbi:MULTISPECIES: bifunctional adenosylcobinamide kinase/adenosylcobinamide-phosphate guanylyltransferase [Treponema]|uniref:Adenosylcobinamide kinase n=1 Tax=Treponema saccharophilum DSM 2985 TaxID=907348 RepID=H7EI65_9SPIR|nr:MULTISPECIES: bifunctional adenosylcobinamide kinase/adenosylcobinamide-phosphate guanylyltransferase [Treponema]EIC02744.1 putative cobinamide kinase/cobinamide phosphate guanylyltransferase [Treponema saccharophilum DSM 2985]MBQ5536509.1 bifunctional adenosylcobinamide kinase/adenosylcobinamide-phosphate guanylyltransferase [Treponema sp.]BDC96102.1 hypothetical protein TRSA_12010 [Treponema saccharophilum]
MNALVFGGSASGKSAFAEDFASGIVRAGGGRLVYLAAMDPLSGGDAPSRIARHRALRAGKGFSTVEIPRGAFSGLARFSDAPVFSGATVLVEDAGNLVSRALFRGGEIDPDARQSVSAFLSALSVRARDVVLVSPDIFLERLPAMDAGMGEYFSALSGVMSSFARSCSRVVRVVAGIPVDVA